MNGRIEGFKEAMIPAILVVVIPTTLLGFMLSHGKIINFFSIALPLIVLVDISANIINNYSDWEIDKINQKRKAMHKAFKRNDMLVFYLTLLLFIILILFLSKANIYLWASTGLFILLGLLYSLIGKLKDVPILNYLSIAIAYAGLSSAIGFFSGSANIIQFVKWSPIIIFLMLMDLGYSITKDYSDIKGDKLHNKRTFPVIFGKQKSIKIQFFIISLAYIFLLILILIGALNQLFLMLFVSYGIALYILDKIYKTEDKSIEKEMHHNAQRNGLLARLIIICILFLI